MGKTTGNKSKSTARSRRDAVMRKVPRSSFSLTKLFKRPELIRTCFIIFLFLVVISILATWSSEQIKVRDGQIASKTRITRLDFVVEDAVATEAKREEAKNSSPRIYTINNTFIERISASLIGLPTAVAGKTQIAEVTPELVEQFQLTPESLKALQGMSEEGEPTNSWKGSVSRLVRELKKRTPTLTSDEFQVFTTTPASNRALFEGAGTLLRPYQAEAIALPSSKSEATDARFAEFISRMGFRESVVPIIEARLVSDNQPSIQLNAEDTKLLSEQAALKVEAEVEYHNQGDIIWLRGDIISPTQYENAILEQEQFQIAAPFLDRWFPRIGSIGLLAMLSIFIGAYITSTYPRVAKNPLRLFALCSLMALMFGLTVVVTIESPGFIFAAAIAPTLLAVTIACLAYGQRMGMFIAFMQCSLVTIGLSQTIGWFVLLIAGCGMMISQIKEVRHRQTLITGAAITAIAFVIGSLFLGLVEVPGITVAWKQIVTHSFVAGVSALVVGFFVLGILPSIERLFDITTGMTLTDYRDPRNAILAQLQDLAPGTFNHSQQVANIAEAAADAIGADSLLAYVGGLYHDIGKMNKPEYFVENQTGYNRHKDLKPSMSLLVIIGHVKDGIEIAHEHDLPRDLIHFIESHHGTTLVEYFYHAALKETKENREPINEVQFRYPGPKPQTKETAILMIADAVESASRVLPDPNPARIETLVRDLSRKRLLDHQFDDCGLTFRELAEIEDAIISRLNSIYHTRIKYPEDDKPEESNHAVIVSEEEGELAG